MKKACLLLVLLFGVPAQAAHLRFPKIVFGNVFVRVTEVCQTGEMLFGGTFDECVKWDTRPENHDCLETQTTSLFTPIEYDYQVCAQWTGESCIKYQSGHGSWPLSYRIPFVDDRDELDRGREPVYYTIPDCDDDNFATGKGRYR
jgi:hypothetical protein